MLKMIGRPCRRRWGKMSDNENNEKLLSTVEAADLKGVKRGSIHRAIREGRLPATWVEKPAAPWRIDRPGTSSPGGSWKIKRTDLDAWQPADQAEKGRRGGRPRKEKDEQA